MTTRKNPAAGALGRLDGLKGVELPAREPVGNLGADLGHCRLVPDLVYTNRLASLQPADAGAPGLRA